MSRHEREECPNNWAQSGLGGVVALPHEWRESEALSIAEHIGFYCVRCLATRVIRRPL